MHALQWLTFQVPQVSNLRVSFALCSLIWVVSNLSVTPIYTFPQDWLAVAPCMLYNGRLSKFPILQASLCSLIWVVSNLRVTPIYTFPQLQGMQCKTDGFKQMADLVSEDHKSCQPVGRDLLGD